MGGFVPSYAFRWTRSDGFRYIGNGATYAYMVGGLNNLGAIVGHDGGRGQFVWTPGQGIQPLVDGGSGRWPSIAINDLGTIVGTVAGQNGRQVAAILTNPAPTVLGMLPGDYSSFPVDINWHGMVIGESQSQFGGVTGAFLWTENEGLRSLSALAGLPNDVLLSASAINDRGQIVGVAQRSGQFSGFLLSPDSLLDPGPSLGEEPLAVPLPATVWLLVGGLALMLRAARRPRGV